MDLEPFLAENWKAGVSPKTGNPVYERPVVLVIYREDHKFLLDPIIPKPGGTVANYDLVIASQPYRARASVDFKAKRVIAPLARALGPGGRLIAIHSYGNDPGMEIIQKVWPGDNPFTTDRHQILKAVKHELGPAGRDLNFNAYADNRSLFRYEMHTLPSEMSGVDRHLDRCSRPGTPRSTWRRSRTTGSASVVQRRPLSRRDARGAAQARRAVVLRRILRDLAPARLSHGMLPCSLLASTADAAPRPPRPSRRSCAARSLEATRPNAADVAALQGRAAAPARRSISAPCRRGRRRSWSSRRRACARPGLEPVPHLAVRNFASADALDALPRPADRRGRRAQAAGDRGRPRRACRAVPWRAGSDRLRVDRAHGIGEIGISGYPDGHPRIAGSGARPRCSPRKLEAAAQTGLKVDIVTQFCLDAAPIIAWVEAPARARHRSSGAHRACRADQPHHADALRPALRRARLGAGARAQCRA